MDVALKPRVLGVELTRELEVVHDLLVEHLAENARHKYWPCVTDSCSNICKNRSSPRLGLKLHTMRVIAISTLKVFWEESAHKDAEQPLKAWYEEATQAQWQTPADIKGNDYRLVVAVSYKMQLVFVKFIGTHKAYDAIDAEMVEPV